MTSDQLTIYLQDHHAGARFGLELARRAAGENEGTEYGDFLTALAAEGLIGGVRTKLALWHALRERSAFDENLDAERLDELAFRAEQQLEGLREQHSRAARQALVTA